MRNRTFNQIAYLLLLITSILTVASCQDQMHFEFEDTHVTNDDIRKIDQLLTDIKPLLALKSENIGNLEALTFEVVKNNHTGAITIENIKTEAYLPFDKLPKNSASYQVDCNLGGTDDWSESCSGAMACAKLVKQCLDAGGCATIYTQKSSQDHFNSVKMIYLKNLK